MADVFISYSNKDRDRVKPIVKLLENHGLTVWWDRSLVPGDNFERVIDAMLSESKAIVVVWSKAAKNSHWVMSEADTGLQQGKLCPVTLDNSRIPRPFDRIETLNLAEWSGQDSPEARTLISGIEARISGDPMPIAGATFSATKRRYKGLILTTMSFFVMLIGLLFGLSFVNDNGVLPKMFAKSSLPEIESPIQSRQDVSNFRLEGQEGAVRLALNSLLQAQIPSDQIVMALAEEKDIDAAVKKLYDSYFERMETLSISERIDILHQIGAFVYGRDTDLAIAIYSELLSQAPGDPLANVRIGRMYHLQAKSNLAKYHFQIVTDNPLASLPLKLRAKDYLGGLLLSDDDYHAAITWLEPVAAEAKENGIDDVYSGATIRISIALKHLEKYTEAVERLEGLIALQKKSKLDDHLASTYQELAEIAEIEDQLNLAEQYLKTSLEYQASTQYTLARVDTLITLGEVLFKQGKFQTANARYAEGAALALSQQLLVEFYILTIGQARVDVELGDQQAACHHIAHANSVWENAKEVPGEARLFAAQLDCSTPT